MAGICFDTSIYIKFRPTADVRGFYLSTVVLQELVAGATDSSKIQALAAIYKLFKKEGRLLVPDDQDWWETGSILHKIWRSQRSGNQGKIPKQSSIIVNRLIRDTLIARTAKRVGATVITDNLKDFELIKQYCSVIVKSGADYFSIKEPSSDLKRNRRRLHS